MSYRTSRYYWLTFIRHLSESIGIDNDAQVEINYPLMHACIHEFSTVRNILLACEVILVSDQHDVRLSQQFSRRLAGSIFFAGHVITSSWFALKNWPCWFEIIVCLNIHIVYGGVCQIWPVMAAIKLLVGVYLILIGIVIELTVFLKLNMQYGTTESF